jgi:hypothetical protein
MSSLRPIFTALTICLVALAQQLCCCLVAPAVTSLLAADSAAPGHCCHHHCGDEDPSDHDDGQDKLPDPHDCECRLGRHLAQIDAKVRPFADPDNDPGVPQVILAAALTMAPWQSDPFAIAARAGPSPGSSARPAGPPATPLAQRVMLTV